LWEWAFRWRQDRREERAAQQTLEHNDARLVLELLEASVSAAQQLADNADAGEKAIRTADLNAALEEKRDVARAALRGLFPALVDEATGKPKEIEAEARTVE
jgi:hypothetical protein